MEKLHKFLDFLTPYGPHSYVVLFGALIACGFGLPLPEDVVLISGGILAARGITEFWMVVVVCMVGVLGGDSVVFLIGRHFGAAVKSKGFFRKIISEETDKRVLGIIQKYGDKVVFMARFMPGLRTPIFMTCGIYQVPFWKFLMLDGFAAIISVPLWVWVGHLFGSNLEELEKRIKQFKFGFAAILILLVVFFLISKIVRKKTLNKIEA
jgi:membrane protein DedA with SNARE-associated domain